MKATIGILVIFITALFSSGISMQHVKIGDPEKSLKSIMLKIEAKEDGMVKYLTQNNNHFSVTLENGKVVYMENDWLQKPEGKKPLFSNFVFGKTSLREIRKTFGTNGFTYKERSAFTTDTDLIQFNCFEFDSPNNEVLVLITKVALDAELTEENVSDKLKLDAIIIADKKYMDATWGSEKIFDPNYKKIKP
ncbi:hypothetical protein [Flavobacterium pedocola]